MSDGLEDEPGQLLLHVLGISEWFGIHQAAGCIGTDAALKKLHTLISTLNYIKNIDEDELETCRVHGRKIARLLSYPSHDTSLPIASVTTTDIASKLRGNPLLNTEWLSPEERLAFSDSIDGAHSSQKELDDSKTDGEPFVPISPPRFIEWESSKVDCCMWRIPNINNLAPLSIDMWQSWASLSTDDIKMCRANALRGFSWIESFPPIMTTWPMTVFRAPKYKFLIAAGAKIRGNFITNAARIPQEHKTKFWNWHRPLTLLM